MLMILRRLIGCSFRWLRRTFNYLCQLDLNVKTAKGLASCLVKPPLTVEEKAERLREYILRNVNKSDQEEVIKHFRQLSTENDPLEDVETEVADSVLSGKANISSNNIRTTKCPGE